MIYTLSNPEILKIRNVKVTHKVKDEDSKKQYSKNQQQLQKEDLTPRQYSQKKQLPTKQIMFHKIYQTDSITHQTLQQKIDRQVKKVKSHYESEINNLINSHKRNFQDLQIKFSVAEKQKNHWRQTALKLKGDFENLNKMGNLKNQIVNKNSQISLHEQQNYMKIQKLNEQQISKLKIANSQVLAQIIKLRQENSKLIHKITKLETQTVVKVDQGMKTHHYQRNRPESPMRRNSQSPSKPHSTEKEARKNQQRDNFPENNFPHMHIQSQKQLDRLRRMCRKMDETIADRNDEIMKVKAKQLAQKYSRTVFY